MLQCVYPKNYRLQLAARLGMYTQLNVSTRVLIHGIKLGCI